MIAPAKALALTPTLKQIDYGMSLQGEKLSAFKLFDAEVKTSERYAVMITGGLHGNEYMGLVRKFPHHFSKLESVQKFLSLGGIIYFVPMINPDGVKNRGRSNTEGLDLNRTFLSEYYSERRESSQLSDWFEKEVNEVGLKLVFSMDYHCCKGALIYPEVSAQTWNSKRSFYESIFAKTATHMKSELDSNYNSGVTKEIFGYETRGTLKDYWFQKYGTISFTFEGSSPSQEIRKISRHVSWWDKVFGEITSLSQQSVAMISPEWIPSSGSELSPATAQSE